MLSLKPNIQGGAEPTDTFQMVIDNTVEYQYNEILGTSEINLL